jgi:hypothetical protein
MKKMSQGVIFFNILKFALKKKICQEKTENLAGRLMPMGRAFVLVP